MQVIKTLIVSLLSRNRFDESLLIFIKFKILISDLQQ